jgi:hypothetical protein
MSGTPSEAKEDASATSIPGPDRPAPGERVLNEAFADELDAMAASTMFADRMSGFRAMRAHIDRRIAQAEAQKSAPDTGGGLAPARTDPGESEGGEAMAPSRRPDRRESAFRRERAIYEVRKSDLLKNGEGQFVVIRGEEIAGVWPTYEEALAAGYQRFGLTPFLVKQVLITDPVYTFTRDVLPCPT